MAHSSLTDLHKLVWIALMAACIATGAYLIVPIGPVPVSMQPLFICLAGFLLGPRHGVLAMGLYLLAGLIGLPVFAGGKSGLGHLLGPTGGYLFGFMFTAFFCGLARMKDGTVSWARGIPAGFSAVCAAYLIGAIWLKFALNLTWTKAAAVGIIPFIPWDIFKVILAMACARHLARLHLLPNQW